MKHHRPVVHVTPTGTIRQCQDCMQSWELVRQADGSQWRPIEETNEQFMVLKNKRDVWECEGSAPVIQERSTKATSVGSSSTRYCFCSDCKTKNKKQHYDGDENCYCANCRGKQRHQVVRGG